MRYEEFDDIHALADTMEKLSDEYKWTQDPVLYKAILYTGVICGKFDLIVEKGEWLATDTVVVCTESKKPFFEHESRNTWIVLKDGIAEEVCAKNDTNGIHQEHSS